MYFSFGGAACSDYRIGEPTLFRELAVVLTSMPLAPGACVPAMKNKPRAQPLKEHLLFEYEALIALPLTQELLSGADGAHESWKSVLSFTEEAGRGRIFARVGHVRENCEAGAAEVAGNAMNSRRSQPVSIPCSSL